MASVLVTGSSDGLGLTAARLLIAAGHAVTLHARNEKRAADARAVLPAADATVIGDLSVIDGMREVAEQANRLGRFDAVIHNAAVGSRRPRQVTADGLEHVFATNTLAPYVLTELLQPPSRLVYLTSNMHRSGHPDLDDPQWERREWAGGQAYADSKLFVVALAFATARRRPGVRSNAVDPGWVATRMGGPGGSKDFILGAATQVWLAVGEEPDTEVTGKYFLHQEQQAPHPAAKDEAFQERLLAYCAGLV